MNGKTLAASTGIGMALGQILIWVLETFYLDSKIPSEIAIAVGTVLTGLLAGIGIAGKWFLDRRSKRNEETFTDYPDGHR